MVSLSEKPVYLTPPCMYLVLLIALKNPFKKKGWFKKSNLIIRQKIELGKFDLDSGYFGTVLEVFEGEGFFANGNGVFLGEISNHQFTFFDRVGF